MIDQTPDFSVFDMRMRERVFMDIKDISGSKVAASVNETERLYRTVSATLEEWDGEGCVIVTANTIRKAKEIAAYLTAYGFAVERRHRDKGKTKEALARFKCGEVDIFIDYNTKKAGKERKDCTLIIHAGLPFSVYDYEAAIDLLSYTEGKTRDVLIVSRAQFAQHKKLMSSADGKTLGSFKKTLEKRKCLHQFLARKSYFAKEDAKRCKDRCAMCAVRKMMA